MRIGVITPHAAAGPEDEWPAMAPGHIAVSVARIRAPGAADGEPAPPPSSPDGLRALTASTVLDEAVDSLDPESLDAIAYASTSTAYVLGHDAETELLDRLSRTYEIPAASTSAAAVTALRRLGVARLALVHPPWFGDDLNALGAGYFRDQGFDVVAAYLADLPSDPNRIAPREVIAWITTNVTDEAQALFLGGNGFRGAAAIAGLEQVLRRPVVSSNQVLLWSLLQSTGRRIAVSGYGSMFEPHPPAC